MGLRALLAAVEERCRSLPAGILHVERFSPKSITPVEVEKTFVVELARAGKSVTIPGGANLLDTLAEMDVDVTHSCREGTCGTCITTVLAGIPDHRDSVLTAAALAVAGAVRTGTFSVNSYTYNIEAPFGGVKSSGVGRDTGREGVTSFYELKTVNIDESAEAAVARLVAGGTV